MNTKPQYSPRSTRGPEQVQLGVPFCPSRPTSSEVGAFVRTILSSSPVRLLSVLLLLLFLSSCCEDEPLKEPIRVYGYGVPTALAISPDGWSFISGGPSRAVLRDIESGQVLQVFNVGWNRRTDDPPLPTPVNTVTALAFSPDGSRLLIVDADQTVQLWDVNTGQPLTTVEGPTNDVSAVAFSADGATVARGSSDGTVRLWEVASGRAVATLTAHTNAVSSISLARDGSTVLTASADDRVARLWNVGRAELLQSFAVGESIQVVAFTPDEVDVVVASQSWNEQERVWVGHVQWFDPTTAEVLHKLEGQPEGVNSLAFSPDGSQLITAHNDGAARLWEVASGRLAGTLQHPGSVLSASFTPDGSRVLTRTGWDYPGVWLWEIATGELRRRFEGYAREIASVAFSPSGDRVVTGARNPGAVWLWDVATGDLLRSFDQTNEVRSVAFSPDGTQLLVGGSHPGLTTNSVVGRACLWDVQTGQCLQAIEEDMPVSAVAFSPDSKTILIGCGSDDSLDGYARLRSVETGEVLRTFTNEWLFATTSATFSADGTQVLTGHGYGLGWSGAGEANLWDVQTGNLLRTLTDPDFHPVGSAVFSPDGAQILVMTLDLHSFDRSTGQLVTTVPIKQNDSYPPHGSAIYSPTGTQFLVTSAYYFMGGVAAECGQLLDPETGHVACSLPWGGPPGSFSADGKRVLTGGTTGVAALWDIRDTFALLQIQRGAAGIQVTWDTGTLQYAPSVQGPWIDLPAASPFRLSTIGEQGYFRVKIE